MHADGRAAQGTLLFFAAASLPCLFSISMRKSFFVLSSLSVASLVHVYTK